MNATPSSSGRWLECVLVAECCRRVVADVERRRHQAVSELVAPLMRPETSWLGRLLKCKPQPRFRKREDAVDWLRTDCYGMELYFAETKHESTLEVASQLLRLAKAPGGSTLIFVSAADFDRIDYMWGATLLPSLFDDAAPRTTPTPTRN